MTSIFEKLRKKSSEKESKVPTQTSSISSKNWLERFFDRHFLILPSWARIIVYFLFLIAFLHNYLKPTLLEGTIWLERSYGDTVETVPASGYTIQTGHYQFKANDSGFWVLKTDRKMPGSLHVSILDEKGRRVDTTKLALPLPFISQLFGNRYDIVYNETKKTIAVSASRLPSLQSPFKVYAQDSTTPAIRANRTEQLEVRIKQISLLSLGSGTRLYMKVILDEEEVKAPNLPQEEYPNTDLYIRQGRVVFPSDLIFLIPKPADGEDQKLSIHFFIRSRSVLFFSRPDIFVGEFDFTVDTNSLGSLLESRDSSANSIAIELSRNEDKGPLLPPAAAEAVAAGLVTEETLAGRHPSILRSEPKRLAAEHIREMIDSSGFDYPPEDLHGTFENQFEEAEADYGVKVVIDRATGLMWQRSGSSKKVTWKGAPEYIHGLNLSSFGGFSDWRLPTIAELASLLDSSGQGSSIISPIFDRRILGSWSSDRGESFGRPLQFKFDLEVTSPILADRRAIIEPDPNLDRILLEDAMSDDEVHVPFVSDSLLSSRSAFSYVRAVRSMERKK